MRVLILSFLLGDFMIFPEWVMGNCLSDNKKDGEWFFRLFLLEELSTFWEINAFEIQVPVTY